MRRLLLAFALTLGCAGAPAPAPSAVPASARDAPAAIAAPAPEIAGDCPLTLPDQVAARASIDRAPRELYERAIPPVLRALCACTRSGDRVDVRASIAPKSGEVRASAPDQPTVNACLARQLNPGVFEPFDLDARACADCGPHHLAAPARPERIAAFQAANGGPPAATPARASSPAPGPNGAPLVVPFSYARGAP
jgi:hypothetical protein